MFKLLLIFGLHWTALLSSRASNNVFGWRCVKDGGGEKCLRGKNLPDHYSLSLSTCLLTCGEAATLVPRPKYVSLEKEITHFLPLDVRHNAWDCRGKVCSLISEAFLIMVNTLHKYHPQYNDGPISQLWGRRTGVLHLDHTLLVQISVTEANEYLTLQTNESYTLKISTKGKETLANIDASTFFGARHGLETLSQLIDYDREKNSLQIVKSGLVVDSPEFPYRGVLLDTSRNFYPLRILKSVIDGMSYNKLNYFHWHISDTHSFPLSLRNLPLMAKYGAYSDHETYTPEDVKDLVQYARVRGVKIVPELDAPAHVGHGWDWGEDEGIGSLVVCLGQQPWTSYCVEPPCGQLNLANRNIYSVLEKIYEEMVDIFSPLEMFHFGGDEIQIACWNSSTEIQDWMTNQGFGLEEESYYGRWIIFQEKARKLLVRANKGKEIPGILWTSTLTDKHRIESFANKNKYVIQIWTNSTNPVIKDLLEKGYRVIFSNYDSLYLDCGVASWVSEGTNWCSPYKGWQGVYDNDIRSIAFDHTGSNQYDHQILGSEVALWSEQIDGSTVETKLWPRGAAHAERLWTNPSNNYSFAESRILNHRHRMIRRGLSAERLQPEWCRQNGGQCPKPWAPTEDKTTSNSDLYLKFLNDENAVASDVTLSIMLLLIFLVLVVATMSKYYIKQPAYFYYRSCYLLVAMAYRSVLNNRLHLLLLAVFVIVFFSIFASFLR